jgi:hypothetical protein
MKPNVIYSMLKFLQRIERDFMSHTDSISASLGVHRYKRQSTSTRCRPGSVAGI